MSIDFQKIKYRLKNFKWQANGELFDLWSMKGQDMCDDDQLDFVINEAVLEWATDVPQLDKKRWDGLTLTNGTRIYSLPSDLLVATEFRVAHDDSIDFRGSPLIPVYEPWLDAINAENKALVSINGLSDGEISAYFYEDFVVDELPKTVTFASLGADKFGNTPPTTFDNAPYIESIESKSSRRIYVQDGSESTTQFIISGVDTAGADPTFNGNFTIRVVGGSLQFSVNSGRDVPERVLIWQDKFYVDPVPNFDYPYRIFGYRKPTALSDDSDAPVALDFYHRTIFLKCKLNTAKEIGDQRGVVGGQFDLDYSQAISRVVDFDRRRHNAVMMMEIPDYGS